MTASEEARQPRPLTLALPLADGEAKVTLVGYRFPIAERKSSLATEPSLLPFQRGSVGEAQNEWVQPSALLRMQKPDSGYPRCRSSLGEY
jgi:hypothetical protein